MGLGAVRKRRQRRRSPWQGEPRCGAQRSRSRQVRPRPAAVAGPARPHLVGRGVTLVNLAGIGGVGLMQFVSGRIHESMQGTATVTAPYTTIFAFFGLALLAGSLIFLFARDNVD